ncbi:MAG: hypothetical protein U9Q78_07495 [Chloroflexota bacterium]|nr:hypothetical protein [Chloroflexota bacterium]
MAKQEVIPEFRPLFDTSEKEKEAREHQNHIKKTEKHIDDIQARMETESLPEDAVTRLTAVLNSSQEELQNERTRLQRWEREMKQSQVISRSLGFLFYIVLGGVFGSLLAGRVQVEGVSGDLPNFFESIVIGATWTSYLSVIGFSQVGKKVDEKIEAAKKEIVDAARETERTGQPLPADAVAEIAAEKLDLARMSVQSDVKRIL